MKIAIASDHGGFSAKEQIRAHLSTLGHETVDFGCHSTQSVDYPDFGFPACEAVASGACERGIVICTTGIGMCIVANKVRGVRAALCTCVRQAVLTREHNDSNVLALGAGVTDMDTIFPIIDAWLSTAFSGGERHARRIEKIANYENASKGEQV